MLHAIRTGFLLTFGLSFVGCTLPSPNRTDSLAPTNPPEELSVFGVATEKEGRHIIDLYIYCTGNQPIFVNDQMLVSEELSNADYRPDIWAITSFGRPGYTYIDPIELDPNRGNAIPGSVRKYSFVGIDASDIDYRHATLKITCSLFILKKQPDGSFVASDTVKLHCVVVNLIKEEQKI